MKRMLLPIPAPFALALCTVTPACAAHNEPPPVPGGVLGTLVQGKYACELPGVAGGPVGVEQPEYAFQIVNSSSYIAGGEQGSYLLTGDKVVMTGGKLKGLTLHRISGGFLRRIEADGKDGELRCVLVTPNNA